MRFKRFIDKSKIARLMYILTERNAITNQEAIAMLVVNSLDKYEPDKRDGLLISRRDLLYEGKPLFRKTMQRIFYEPSFFEKAEFDYYDKIHPYLNSHSLLSLFKTYFKDKKEASTKLKYNVFLR